MGETARVPLKFEIMPGAGLIEIKLSGYIDGDSAREYQAEVEQRVEVMRKRSGGANVGLLYYDELTGFEAGRVARVHGEWFSKMRPMLSKVAIVSKKTSVTLAISIAKLLSKTPLKQFTDAEEARLWLTS